MSEAAFEFNDYSLLLQGKEILKDINLRVTKGECISIIGPNGAGKSSLLKSLLKLLSGGKGKISLFGEPLNKLSQKDVAKKAGYVPQGVKLSFPISVYDFILMGRYAGLGNLEPMRPEDTDAVDYFVQLMNLTPFLKRDIRTLSGGEMQRVLLAGALVQKPALLLLDEPTTFLDPRHSEELYHLIQNIRDNHSISIVFVTHDINRGALFSERIIGMKEGQIIFDGAPELLMQNEILNHIFQADFRLLPHPDRELNIIIPS